RLDTEEFLETMRTVGVHAAVALSTTDHLNGFASERIGTVVDSADIHGLYDEVNDQAPGTAPVASHRHILPKYVTAERLQELHNRGAVVRVVRGPNRADSGWLTICRVDHARNVTFDSDP